MDEHDLLKKYALDHSQEAFGQLVERYVDVVYASAVRQMHDPHLAQDVTQGVFILLAQKAPRVPPDRPLSSWLLKTTRYVAANMRRDAARRRNHEQEAASMSATFQEQPNQEDELQSVACQLDDKLSELREPDRDALLLRFFENKTLRQVGEVLGISEDAAEKRVSRAIERLRKVFARRGVAVGTAALTTFLTVRLAEGAPAGMATSIAAQAKAATVAGGGKALAVGGQSIVKSVTLKVGMALGGVTILVAGVAIEQRASRQHAQPAQNTTPTVAAASTNPTDTYRIPPGEVLRVVRNTPASVRDAVWKQFSLTNRGAKVPMGPFSYNWNSRERVDPTQLEAQTVPKSRAVELACCAVLDLFPWEVEFQNLQLNVPYTIPGDIVYTNELPPALAIPALEAALRRELNLPVTLSLQNVPRKVFVLRGKWTYHRIAEAPSQGAPMRDGRVVDPLIEIFGGDQFDPDVPSLGSGLVNAPPIPGLPNMTMPYLANQIADWIGRREVIIEAEGNLPSVLGWRMHGPADNSPEAAQAAHDPAVVLTHIAEQTGLTWSEETRTVRRLIITSAATN